MVRIHSIDVENHPEDGPPSLLEQKRQIGFPSPYLYDDTQEVAKAYRAACTPDLFHFDADRRLVHRGQMDDSHPGGGRPMTGADLRAELDALLERRSIPADQTPSVGCNIRWKPGNEPDYLRR